MLKISFDWYTSKDPAGQVDEVKVKPAKMVIDVVTLDQRAHEVREEMPVVGVDEYMSEEGW